MVRKGRRHSGKKLEPPLPERRDELNLPKYFGVVKGGGYNRANEERREIIPGPMPKAGDTPRAISGRPPLLHPPPFPAPAPEPERVPLLIRAARYVSGLLGVEPERPEQMPKADEMPKAISVRQPAEPKNPFPAPAPEPERVPILIRAARYVSGLLGVEPERPEQMPVVPEMNYPALYTRFPLMKTVTKVTNSAGEIGVYYSHAFATVPGVVITVKDPDNVFGTVFVTALVGFGVRLFKMTHDHGGVVDDGGKHTPTINADGNHEHNVTGSIGWTENSNYGRLVLANYTDYETAHVHTQVQTQLESIPTHTHHVYPTVGGGKHKHTIPATDGPNSVGTATALMVEGTRWEEWCDACTYHLIEELGEASVALATHWHPNTGKNTGEEPTHVHTNIYTGGGDQHRHLLNSTGIVAAPGHRHLISNDELYDHYITSISDVDLSLLGAATEDPFHAHSGEEIIAHKHDVPEDGRVLLQNTSVTITYIAQEESS